MHRPTRQHQHLLQKIALKDSRSQSHERKPGKRTKAWRKWATQYGPLAGQGGEQQGGETQA